MKLLLLLLSVLVCVACSEDKKASSHREVYIKTSADKPKDCQELGPVSGATIKEAGKGESYKWALKDIRKSAVSLGANYLYLRRVSSDSKFIAGIAYLCKN